jgi:hypothetical protein
MVFKAFCLDPMVTRVRRAETTVVVVWIERAELIARTLLRESESDRGASDARLNRSLCKKRR